MVVINPETVNVSFYKQIGASIYDKSLTLTKSSDNTYSVVGGWEIQRPYAKKLYTKYVKEQRTRNPNYRRPFKYNDEGEKVYIRERIYTYDDSNVTYVGRKMIQEYEVVSAPKHKHEQVLDVNNNRPDDENYTRAKTFTRRMGQKIAQTRNERKMTQEELAYAMNLEPNVIRDIENGSESVTYTSELARLFYNVLKVAVPYQQ